MSKNDWAIMVVIKWSCAKRIDSKSLVVFIFSTNWLYCASSTSTCCKSRLHIITLQRGSSFQRTHNQKSTFGKTRNEFSTTPEINTHFQWALLSKTKPELEMCMNVPHPLQVLTCPDLQHFFPQLLTTLFLFVTKSQKLCQETTTQVAKTILLVVKLLPV